MPYYIYAVQAGAGSSHLCGPFADYQGAEIWERDNPKGNDRDFIMIYAENKTHALQKMRQIRRERGL